jgi:hypothetical protein
LPPPDRLGRRLRPAERASPFEGPGICWSGTSAATGARSARRHRPPRRLNDFPGKSARRNLRTLRACVAADGSYWALQSWQRGLPDYGLAPTKAQAAFELRLSHWTGGLASLEVYTGWAYRKYDQLFGRLTYADQAVFGFRSTPAGIPLDSYGRNLYLDTFNAAYGPGWVRENSFLTHRPGGTFCYGFYPHGHHPAGNGQRYRITVIGPGVTPDAVWEGATPGAYDPNRAQEQVSLQRTLMSGDTSCRPHP